MRTIKFYNDTGSFMGWKKLKSFCVNWLECKSWINSGNSLIIDNIKVEAYMLGKLRVVLE